MLTKIITTIPDAVIDLRYASKNNIAKKALYDSNNALLRPLALRALKHAADDLRAKGYRLVIWDAYRPHKVQEQLRAICDDSTYVAEVSNHSRGISVDVTLTDSRGNYLDMGTDFDEFTEKAHSQYDNLTDVQKENRGILSAAMREAGFTQLLSEWWHFDFITNDEPTIIEGAL